MKILPGLVKGLAVFSLFGCSTLSLVVNPATPPRATDTAQPATATLSPTATSTDTETPTPTPVPTELPYTMVEIKGGEKLADVLFRECQNAKALGRTPYIQFYASWCQACRELRRAMDDERMIHAFRGTYIILADIDTWDHQLPSVGLYVTGVPSIYELTFEGKPTGRFITGAAWEDNDPESMAPPLDKFFHPNG